MNRTGCQTDVESKFANATKALRGYVVYYPILLHLAFLATWLAGGAYLGHWPRPSLDDPQDIGALVDVFYSLTALMLTIGLLVFAVGVFCLLCLASRDQARRRELLFISAGSALSMVGTILLLRSDPFGIMSWYMD